MTLTSAEMLDIAVRAQHMTPKVFNLFPAVGNVDPKSYCVLILLELVFSIPGNGCANAFSLSPNPGARQQLCNTRDQLPRHIGEAARSSCENVFEGPVQVEVSTRANIEDTSCKPGSYILPLQYRPEALGRGMRGY